MSLNKNKWIRHGSCSKTAGMNLFCFAHAGGSARVFLEWKAYFGDEINIFPVQLPMRENRVREKMYASLPDLVTAFLEENQEYFDWPYALFGHSLGAMIAYETARKCEICGFKVPEMIFLSAAMPPEIKQQKKIQVSGTDYEILKNLVDFQGTDISLLRNKQFCDYLLPIIRADFQIFDSYDQICKDSLTVPIIAYRGRQDLFVTDEEMTEWNRYTQSEFYQQTFPGDHFYISRYRKELIDSVKYYLTTVRKGEEYAEKRMGAAHYL